MFFKDSNATLDFRDDFARDFSLWDTNKDGVIDIPEVGNNKKWSKSHTDRIYIFMWFDGRAEMIGFQENIHRMLSNHQSAIPAVKLLITKTLASRLS